MKGRIETKNGKLRVTVKVDMHGHLDGFEFTTVADPYGAMSALALISSASPPGADVISAGAYSL